MDIERLECEAMRINRDSSRFIRLANVGCGLRDISRNLENSWKNMKETAKEDSTDGDVYKSYTAKRSHIMSRLYYIKHVFNLMKSAANKSDKSLADLKVAVGDFDYIKRALRSIGADIELQCSFVNCCRDIID